MVVYIFAFSALVNLNRQLIASAHCNSSIFAISSIARYSVHFQLPPLLSVARYSSYRNIARSLSPSRVSVLLLTTVATGALSFAPPHVTLPFLATPATVYCPLPLSLRRASVSSVARYSGYWCFANSFFLSVARL